MASVFVSNPNPSNNDSTQNLPQDIIIDILTKLAVKSLIRFKGVCKSWYFLIKDDEFIKQHYDHTRKNCQKYFTVSRRHNMKNQFNFYHYTMDVPQLDSSSTASLIESPVPMNQLQMVIIIEYVSYNGIILIAYTDDKIIMWNLATRESRRIPCPIQSKWDGASLCGLYDFCYFPRINGYKIFRLGHIYVDGYVEMDIDIFSTKGNTWKSIGPFPPNYYFFGSSVVILDGIVYLLAKRRGDHVLTILRFCMEKEQFQEELLVPYMTERTCYVLCALGENLCLSRKCVDYHDYSMCINHEFWLYSMKTNSWNKILTIPLPNHCIYLTHLSFMKNGDMLFQYSGNSGFLAYNLTTHKLRKVNVAGIQAGLNFRKVVTYVETLSSPNNS